MELQLQFVNSRFLNLKKQTSESFLQLSMDQQGFTAMSLPAKSLSFQLNYVFWLLHLLFHAFILDMMFSQWDSRFVAL
jgi:hypothetical protein